MKKLLLPVVLLLVGCVGSNSKIAKKALPQTVMITVGNLEKVNGSQEYKEVRVTGAGVFISPSGHILTAAHLFHEKVGYAFIQPYLNPESFYGAVILYVDKSRDLALLKVDYPSRNYAKLARRRSVQVGNPVLAIGHPLGLEWTVTHGIVSKFAENELLVQTDASLNRGNSGGPLYDDKGNLIGINIHLYSPSPFAPSVGLGRAASIKSIQQFLSLFKDLSID